ncbi:accessory Sec system translocase SecA2 [Fictibacillus phosphorivorans]|uniref:accessory Sec system translocase SecA2 n=1 Tax=Fictibacillus phosphorivorans TaxID=1221500 RepID=UPI0011A1E7CE|nr:accessory Sec system translocase SecA2 [Fictibacillus phosphorivorans]
MLLGLKASSKSNKTFKRFKKSIETINKLESSYQKLSDLELKEKTLLFKEALSNGKSIDDISEEAFATVREAAFRVLGLRAYDVQLIGGLALLNNEIAEMQTGEGKTLVAAFPSYVKALEGKGAHVITVNEYLANRDYETIGKIHEFLGLTVGLNISQMDPVEKQQAYLCDLTYGTGSEFGFDYLRDNMVQDISQRVQRPLHFALIDEVDSILIDEAKTPLVIASKSSESANLFKVTALVVENFQNDVDYNLEVNTKQVFLTDEGANKIERAFGINNLYDAEHQLLNHFVNQSLKALVIMRKDIDYIIREGKIMLVDQFTGRVMDGRSYSNGLHQAIEAKEGVEITEENQTFATITIQNYFQLYRSLSGLTGTALTDKDEFLQTYGLAVSVIPTNRDRQRIDLEDVVYETSEQKYKKIIDTVKELYKEKRPVLIGTTSIEQSEKLAEGLKKAKIPHQLLNAKSEELEAEMISKAGKQGMITIATNMAGRGTDIMLDEKVKQAGGLFILGTERHESRRIDNQLRGRAGRQGDPGTTQFVISLEDELFNLYDQELIENWKKKIKTDENGQVMSPKAIKYISNVQEAIESIHYSSRSHMLKLESVIENQRDTIYKLRNELLETDNIRDRAEETLRSTGLMIIEQECQEELVAEEWNLAQLVKQLSEIFPFESFSIEDIKGKERYEIEAEFLLKVKHAFEQEELLQLCQSEQVRGVYLQTLDQNWIRHLENMQNLKEGINLHSYGQEDPTRAFEKNGFALFKDMTFDLNKEILNRVKLLLQMEFNQNINDQALSTMEV